MSRKFSTSENLSVQFYVKIDNELITSSEVENVFAKLTHVDMVKELEFVVR